MDNRICKQCGGPVVGRRKNALYCSNACNKAADPGRRKASPARQGRYLEGKAEWRASAPEQSCPVCGATFRPACRDKAVRTCSYDCSNVLKSREATEKREAGQLARGVRSHLRYRVCGDCGRVLSLRPWPTPGIVVLTKQANRPHPCETCAVSASDVWVGGTCLRCGESFVSRYPGGKVGNFPRYCSTACASRTAKHKRRAKMKAVEYEPVSPVVVAERDEWLCQLCGRAIPRDVPYYDSMAFTLDHIVALDNGGPHTYANVQAAHRLCNSYKGTSDPNASVGDIFETWLLSNGGYTL